MILYRAALCIGLVAGLGITEEEQIRLLKQIGFDGFFTGWSAQTDVAALRRIADETGMRYQSIHAPFGQIADLWEENERTCAVLEEQLACVQACAEGGVPLMVTHAIIGFDRHQPTAFGVENFRKVVDRASALGVRIAFENTEGPEYLAMLMDAFRDHPYVGFCWDSGHELCYNRGEDMLAHYGDRLFGTHLNDNLGVSAADGHIAPTDDLHLLPFDGVADWADAAHRLNAHGFDGPLTFELKTRSQRGRHENDAYARMTPEDYLSLAYMRACRVGTLLLRDRDRSKQ